MSLNDVQFSLMSLDFLTGCNVDENENTVKEERANYDSFEMLKKQRKSR